MYKLFLCLRYLKKLLMAYFAILCVALCVAMMLIVISVMNGFLDKIEVAAKGLFGDIVIDAPSANGVGRYDEFIDELKEKAPEVQAATPYIFTYGLLKIPNQAAHQQLVQIAGIRLPERAETTSFGKGLFVQRNLAKPTFDPPISLMLSQIKADTDEATDILKRVGKEIENLRKELKNCDDAPETEVLSTRLAAREFLASRIDSSIYRRQVFGERTLLRAKPYQEEMARLNKQLDEARARTKKRFEGPEYDAEMDISARINALVENTGFQSPANRVILGVGLSPLTFRTPDGDTIRQISSGESIVLSVFPLGQRETALNEALFTIVDDSRTDVAPMDSKTVYVPFETLQRLNMMDAEYAVDNPDKVVIPARCSQIHIKVAEEFAHGQALIDVRDKVLVAWENYCEAAAWKDFHRDHPDAATAWKDILRDHPDADASWKTSLRHNSSVTAWMVFHKRHPRAATAWESFLRDHPDDVDGWVNFRATAAEQVNVMTWRQFQQDFIGPIEKQRTLSVIMFSIVSLVSVVLIFVIFYMIVYQKIRDIGVLKAIGASSTGVAQIFLFYGAAVGLVGSILGTIGGYYFVRYINEIQDSIDRWFGFRVWTREVFMFEKIPNQVNWSDALWIVAFSIMFGLLGALVPAIQAARKQPVEALRYE